MSETPKNADVICEQPLSVNALARKHFQQGECLSLVGAFSVIVKTSDPALELTDRVPTFLRAGVIGAGW